MMPIFINNNFCSIIDLALEVRVCKLVLKYHFWIVVPYIILGIHKGGSLGISPEYVMENDFHGESPCVVASIVSYRFLCE